MPFSVVTKKRCVLILSFLIIITLPPDLPEAFFSITANNKALVGFTYRVIDNADWLDCIQACQAEVSCISYNFWQGRCELNNCGFEDGCSAESTLLIWVPGSTFQQLAPIQDEKSRCKDKRESSVKKNVRVMINASFSCTQNMSAYVDGDFVTFLNSRKPVKDIDCSKLQTQAINFAIPNSTRVVAIAATGIPRASIIGSFSDGVVTDSTWKCNSDKQPKWALPDFKDDLWKEAEETSPEKGGTNGITEISSEAKWIHITADDSTQNMFCRLSRKIGSLN